MRQNIVMKFDTIKSFREWFVICRCVSRPRFMIIMRVFEIATSKKKGKSFVIEKQCQLVSSCFRKTRSQEMNKSATHFGRGFAYNTTKATQILMHIDQ